MAKSGPGKAYRKGLRFFQIADMFPDDAAAEAWFVERRWAEGPHCPHCGSLNIQTPIKHKSMTHRCRDCPKRVQFSLKTGTVMEGSKLGYRVWAIAIYMLVTNLKSASSMKMHRELGVTQKTAWHLAHRLRETWTADGHPFAGPVEFDETHIGGRRKNMPKAKRKAMTGRGTAGKTAVVGAKDRATNRVSARKIRNTDGPTLKGFVAEHAAPGATVFTDDASGYRGMPFDHESVNHSAGEYVRGMAHTNGIESFWSIRIPPMDAASDRSRCMISLP